MKFHNTLTRKKDEFKEIEKGNVLMYSCGPTIYNYAHIGNFRAYVFADLLRRYLKFKGFKVTQVMNLTDVDDKTIKGSQKEGIPLSKFTKKYEEAFFEDIDALRIQRADEYPAATACIEDMVGMIKELIEKGHTYEKAGSIYFKISTFKDYGKLAKLQLENLKAGARVNQDEYEKENAADFVLWKAYDKDDGDVFWETEIGKGRPGWHIECSAMSTKHLGKHFDIHTGGVDLVFPHHTNEIAQSECSTGEKFVNYWLHNEHLIVDGKKMSKSMGNFFTLRDLLEKGFNPLAVRYVLLATHYRQQLNFTFESITAADNSIQRLNDLIEKLKVIEGHGSDANRIVDKYSSEFVSAMDDDLNISQALASVFEFVREINSILDELGMNGAAQAIEFLRKVDTVLAVMNFEGQNIPKEVQKLAEERENARKSKDFKKADEIRDELKARGYIIEDSASGPRVKANR